MISIFRTPIDVYQHFKMGLIVRVILCGLGELQDRYTRLPYTDIDYTVFTNGASRVLAGGSPYVSSTYRYSPLIAYLLTANRIHLIYGKLLFATADVLVAYGLYGIVRELYHNEKKAIQCALLWLYNPLPIVISTRGNGDSITAVVVLFSLLYQLREKYVISGALLALATHLRLYPVIFLLPFLVTAGRPTAYSTIRSTLRQKARLAIAFGLTLFGITSFFCYLYGDSFLNATVYYHLGRKDVRHNLSLYFYVQYLDSFVNDYVTKNVTFVDAEVMKSLLVTVPQGVLLITLAAKYNTLRHLPFSLFASIFAFVAFNKVLTTQYFIWYLSLLPLILPSVQLSRNKVIAIVTAWLVTFAAWMGSAYLLEFEGYDTYTYIHVSGVAFFAANVWILSEFVRSYNAYYVTKDC